MLFQTIWETVLIFIIGSILLRISGRISISQMTVPQVIAVIGLGTLLVEPVSGHGLGYTMLAAVIIVIIMVLFEYLELKFDFFETLSVGKSKIIIEDGKLNLKNLKKMRFTIDKLEARLRESGISNIEDVEWATLETSGQIGYTLKYKQQPSTKEDIQVIMDRLHQIEKSISPLLPKKAETANLFTEIKTKQYEGNQKEPN